jgi:hypothetical protein
MSRKERHRPSPDRLAALLASGAHAGAARAARAAPAEPGASEEERARAGSVLASLGPEPFAVAAGLAGVAVAIAIGIWLAMGGAR